MRTLTSSIIYIQKFLHTTYTHITHTYTTLTKLIHNTQTTHTHLARGVVELWVEKSPWGGLDASVCAPLQGGGQTRPVEV